MKTTARPSFQTVQHSHGWPTWGAQRDRARVTRASTGATCSILTALLCFAVIFPPSAVALSCLPTDDPATCTVLSDIWNATNGLGWLNANGWALAAGPAGATTSYCSWYGLLCVNGTVTSVALGSNLLQGSIPPSVGSLTRLVNLQLQSNKLSGTIPVQLTQLTRLTYLQLNTNLLSGTIPDAVGSQLVGLTQLVMYSNLLTGTLPPSLGSLTQLVNLRLYSNAFTGSLPTSLGNLNRCTTLMLQLNKLNGTLPAAFGNLTAMTQLQLNGNNLQGTVPASMGGLTRMQLYLAGSGLCGKLPGALLQADLPSLPPNCSCAFNAPQEQTCATLGDMYTSMGGPGWANQAGWAAAAAGVPTDYCSFFAGVTCAGGDVQTLVFSDLHLNGTIPASINSLSRLQFMFWGHNALVGTLPSLRNLTQLQYIDLSSNGLSGDIGSSNLDVLHQLVFLYLDNGPKSGRKGMRSSVEGKLRC